MGVVVLSNKQTVLPFFLNWWIYDQMSGVRGEDIEDLIRKNVPKENEGAKRPESTVGAEKADKLIMGIYKNNLFGEAVVDIDPKTQGLSVQFNREIAIPLHRQNGNSYFTKSEIPEFDDLWVLFNLGRAGNVKNFEVPFYRDLTPLIFEWTAPIIHFDEKYLSKFVGTYDFRGVDAVIRYSNNTLLVKVGDQPEAVLSPVSEDVFEMISAEKVTVRFDMFDDRGRAVEGSVFLPQGAVRIKRVK